MATTNDLKNGITLDLDGDLSNVVEFQHVKPGKGGAFVRTKLKNLLSGKVVERTFNAGVKVDVAIVEKREMQFLYKEGSDYVGHTKEWGEKKFREYNEAHYHQPSDEFHDDWDFRGMIQEADFAMAIGRRVADAPAMPIFNPGDEFARKK